MSPGLSPALARDFAWIEGFTNFERTHADSLRPFRLDRMRAMAALCGDPQAAVPCVHIAGSKGKGSTAAFIGAILTEAGFRTGIYTSPHVDSYRERYLLGYGKLPEVHLAESLARIRGLFEGYRFEDGSTPTAFELLTLTGMLAFRLAGCEWVVYETGLGGRLDATNIIVPEATVITSIELEHTRILGSTAAEVAREKAGIIKAGVPLITGMLGAEAAEVIDGVAAEREAPRIRAAEVDIIDWNDDAIEFRTAWVPEGSLRLEPGMPGRHQGHNALLAALTTTRLLAGAGDLASTIACGVRAARLPGRFEQLELADGIWIFDAAHTPVSVRAAAETFRRRFPAGGAAIVGVVDDKDTAGICAALPEGLDGVVVARPGSFKASSPELLLETVRGRYPAAEYLPTPEAAAAKARAHAGGKGPVLVIGSFYLLGAVRAALGCMPETAE